MDEEKFEKTLKDAKLFSIIVLVLVIILLVLTLVSGQLKTPIIISSIIQIALLIATAVGCSKKMLYGPICGVIVSILMILSLSIIDLIIGIVYLCECINLIRYMNN